MLACSIYVDPGYEDPDDPGPGPGPDDAGPGGPGGGPGGDDDGGPGGDGGAGGDGGPGSGGDGGPGARITFVDIARDPTRGIDFERAPSLSYAIVEALQEQSLVEPLDPGIGPILPYNTRGQPGVAVFDYDRDGDLDIYATNGPGAANSLFSNQLVETGEVFFEDVAAFAGVAATDQDGMGTCHGDIDNDGDPDLLVLGRHVPNRLFRNNGNRTFTEVENSGLEGSAGLASPSCSMGDVNGDGLLDVFVAHSFHHDSQAACVLLPFEGNQFNDLFINQGNGTFVDASETSGIRNLTGFPPGFEGIPTITWAVGLIDIDLDGDIDIVQGDDQCGFPEARFGGIDRGYIHVLLNDGTAHFTDHPIIVNDRASSSWMGLAFGDLNCDGNLDIFGSNFGDYADSVTTPLPYVLGDQSSRWLLGNGDGTFQDPAVGQIVSVFGWGNGMFDHDNDGDLDVVYHGDIDTTFVQTKDNPGVMLINQGCTAEFEVAVDLWTTDHLRRNVQAVAVGDLDRNGFVDIVSASSFDVPPSMPIEPSPTQWDESIPYASSFNPTAGFITQFEPTPEGMVWNGDEFLPGSLSVELNSGNNGNGWAQVSLLGTKGLTSQGEVNRDGIGAVLRFTPEDTGDGAGPGNGDGNTVMVPIISGSSFGSAHALQATLGLGSATTARLEVIWPNGVRNRLYDVRSRERIVFPEIPCSFDAGGTSFPVYQACVTASLDELTARGVLSSRERARFLVSALRAFFER